MSTATVTALVVASDLVAVKAAIETLATTTGEINHYMLGQMIVFYKSV